MNNKSLSSLYRRLTAQNAMPALDAADLSDAAEGALAADRRESVAQMLAASPAQADLVLMLRDLRAESEALSANVTRINRDSTHRRQRREQRPAAATRRFGGGGMSRWAAVAACMVAVVGAWTLRSSHSTPDAMPTHAQTIARADVIFSTRDRIFGVGMDSVQPGQKVRHEGDHLFRGAFGGG